MCFYTQFPVLLQLNQATFFCFLFSIPRSHDRIVSYIVIWNNKRDHDAGYLFNSHWIKPIATDNAVAPAGIYAYPDTHLFYNTQYKPFRAQSNLI